MVYTPLFTTKERIREASGSKVELSDINDTFLEDGETNVILALKEVGIRYTDLRGDDDVEGNWQGNSSLKKAATYSVLCLMSKVNVKGSVPISGPVTSASADGMSKSFGGSGSLSRGNIKSPFDWCELSAKTIDSLIKSWRASPASAEKSTPTISRANTFYDRDWNVYRKHQNMGY